MSKLKPKQHQKLSKDFIHGLTANGLSLIAIGGIIVCNQMVIQHPNNNFLVVASTIPTGVLTWVAIRLNLYCWHLIFKK